MFSLKKCGAPKGLPRASHAIQWNSENWAIAHVDGTLSIFAAGQLTGVLMHPGDRPTCLAALDAQHVVIGLESGWVHSYDLLNGFRAASQHLPFAPTNILVCESAVVLWSGLALQTAILREATLTIEELISEPDVVLRVCDHKGLSRVYNDRIELGSGGKILLPPNVLDAVPGADGLWCVMWRERWALCDADGQEEFGAGSLGSGFSKLAKTEVGVFMCCDDGSAVNVRNNNVQLLPPLANAVYFGPSALTSDLHEYSLDTENGMTWTDKHQLFSTTLTRPNATCTNGHMTGYLSGCVVDAAGIRVPLFGGPVTKLEDDRAWTIDSVCTLPATLVEPTTTLQRLAIPLIHTSEVDKIEQGQWYALSDETSFRLSPSTAALAAAAGGDVPEELLAKGGIERLEDLLARLDPCSKAHKRVAHLLSEMWDSGRVAALLQSRGLRTLNVLGGAYPQVGATASWLTSNLPQYLDSDKVDFRIAALKIVALHPELNKSTSIPYAALKSVPEPAQEDVVRIYATNAPRDILNALASHREFGLLTTAVETGAFAALIGELVAAVVPEVPKLTAAQKLLTAVKNMYPEQIKFSKPTQRLLVLSNGKLGNWNLGGSRHQHTELTAADSISSVDFTAHGEAVIGTLVSGKHVRWTFPNGLESLFKRDHIEGQYVK